MTARAPLPARIIPPDIIANAYTSLRRVGGMRWAVIDRAYRRWRHNVMPEVCVYGVKDQAIAVDCNCPGCIEKLIFLYFDQVSTKFGVDP